MATKKCPYCAEEIQEEAIFCRYCRQRLDVSQNTETAESEPTEPSQTYMPASRSQAGSSQTQTKAESVTKPFPVKLVVLIIILLGLAGLLIWIICSPPDTKNVSASSLLGLTESELTKIIGQPDDKINGKDFVYENNGRRAFFLFDDTGKVDYIQLAKGNRLTEKIDDALDMNVTVLKTKSMSGASNVLYNDKTRNFECTLKKEKYNVIYGFDSNDGNSVCKCVDIISVSNDSAAPAVTAAPAATTTNAGTTTTAATTTVPETTTTTKVEEPMYCFVPYNTPSKIRNLLPKCIESVEKDLGSGNVEWTDWEGKKHNVGAKNYVGFFSAYHWECHYSGGSGYVEDNWYYCFSIYKKDGSYFLSIFVDCETLETKGTDPHYCLGDYISYYMGEPFDLSARDLAEVWYTRDGKTIYSFQTNVKFKVMPSFDYTLDYGTAGTVGKCDSVIYGIEYETSFDEGFGMTSGQGIYDHIRTGMTKSDVEKILGEKLDVKSGKAEVFVPYVGSFQLIFDDYILKGFSSELAFGA